MQMRVLLSCACTASAGNKLPLELCQGYTMELTLPDDSGNSGTGTSAAAQAYLGPSILGSTYLAAQVCLSAGHLGTLVDLAANILKLHELHLSLYLRRARHVSLL